MTNTPLPTPTSVLLLTCSCRQQFKTFKIKKQTETLGTSLSE